MNTTMNSVNQIFDWGRFTAALSLSILFILFVIFLFRFVIITLIYFFYCSSEKYNNDHESPDQHKRHIYPSA